MNGTTDYAAFEKDASAPVVASHVSVVPAVAMTERVAVVAPTDLPGGYELHCDFQGRPMVVHVVRSIEEGSQCCMLRRALTFASLCVATGRS